MLRQFRAVGLMGLALLGSVGSGTANAQEIRGHVLDSAAESPIEGAYVSLLNGEGTQIDATISDSTGAYSLEAAERGKYRLRVERIGFETWLSEAIILSEHETRSRVIRVPVQAIELGTLRATAKSECTDRPEGSVRTGHLWSEVEKALRTTAWTQQKGDLRYQVRTFRRELDEDGTVQSKESQQGVVERGLPFRSRPAGELAAEGYVRETESGQNVFYAPDAETLVSEPFLRTHCFWVTDGEESGKVGLAFRPKEDRSVPDVQGRLWVDRETAKLRRLNFRYTGLGMDEDLDKEPGGTVRFRRLSNGAWIVSRWHIDMPVFRTWGASAVSWGIELDGWRRIGGSVLEAFGPNGGRLYF